MRDVCKRTFDVTPIAPTSCDHRPGFAGCQAVSFLNGSAFDTVIDESAEANRYDFRSTSLSSLIFRLSNDETAASRTGYC